MTDDSNFNPYQSPQYVPWHPTADVATIHLGDYPAQLMPRDPIDVMYCLGVGIPGGLLFYALPIGLGLLLKIPPLMLPIIFGTLFTTAVAVALSGITSMSVTATECIAKRRFRRHITFAWREVTAVRELTRGEALAVITLAPQRCCSQTTTSRGHFRIERDAEFLVFAPRDIASFRSTVAGLAAKATMPV
jgi:hypothetical protein